MKYLLPIMAVMLTASSAHAHIVANPDKGVAGSYFQTSLRVAHGCGESATTELHVKIPAGIMVHPQHKAGWKIKIIKNKSGDEVIWRGNVLPAEEYDEFGLLMKLPGAADQTLWFPTTQVCKSGRNEWVQIPAEGQAWHDVQSPAPFVRVTD